MADDTAETMMGGPDAPTFMANPDTKKKPNND